MTLLSLETGQPVDFEPYSTANSKISKSQKDTSIRIHWITDPLQIESAKLIDATTIVENILDRGQYYTRPEGAIGVVVHSGNEPCAFAGWYGDNHKGMWNVYGDQPKNSQQIYALGGAETLFVGLF